MDTEEIKDVTSNQLDEGPSECKGIPLRYKYWLIPCEQLDSFVFLIVLILIQHPHYIVN